MNGISNRKKVVLFVVIALLCGLMGGAAYIVCRQYKENELWNKNRSGSNTVLIQKLSGDTIWESGIGVNESEVTSSDLSALVENMMPSVISIKCKEITTEESFFGFPQTYEQTSAGSGFIIGQNGSDILMATNSHVIDEAEEIEVTFNDGKTANASVKGKDAQYDLAVIAVDIRKLEQSTINAIKIAVLGDSDSVKVGSMAVAIGNALGYGQSTTVGYISALEREVTVDGRKMTLLQTDAAINPGNSGGPLISVYGEVIGINSVRFSRADVESMGYAIPVTNAVPIINELMNRENLFEWEKGDLGIVGKDINAAYAQTFIMPEGIYVLEVEEDSPSAKAGVMVGDIIVGINGRRVTSCSELDDILQYIRSGSTVILQIKSLEDGMYIERDVEVVLGKRKG